jgi:hypothetical protein
VLCEINVSSGFPFPEQAPSEIARVATELLSTATYHLRAMLKMHSPAASSRVARAEPSRRCPQRGATEDALPGLLLLLSLR